MRRLPGPADCRLSEGDRTPEALYELFRDWQRTTCLSCKYSHVQYIVVQIEPARETAHWSTAQSDFKREQQNVFTYEQRCSSKMSSPLGK